MKKSILDSKLAPSSASLSVTRPIEIVSQSKYLDITSSTRMRSKYPNPCDFVVACNSTATTWVNPVDPITDAIPISIALTTGAVDASNVNLAVTEPIINNYYYNYYLEMDLGAGYEIHRITAYNGTTYLATVDVAFSGVPAIGTTYWIRKALALETGLFQAGSTTTAVVLAAGSSLIDDYYIGQYLWIPSTNENRRILRYNGTTKVADITALAAAPAAGVYYEILQYTRDNYEPFIYPCETPMEVCYTVDLLNLIIPQQLVSSGHGSFPAFYPYFYLEFLPIDSTYDRAIWTNNLRGSRRALFKIPSDDVRNIATGSGAPLFTCLQRASMSQTIILRPNENFIFRILLPDGETLAFITPDTVPPYPPNPLLQTSATFRFTKVD